MNKSGRVSVWLVAALVGVAIAGVVLPIVFWRKSPPTPSAATPTATAPATQAAATLKKDATKPPEPPPFSYMDVVKVNVPSIPSTQPLPVPLDLPQAAHFVLHDPIYLDGRLNLWITRPEAPPTADVLRKENPEYEYLVRERVLFVHWAPDNRDILTPRIVTPRADGGFDYVSASGRVRLSPTHEYHWAQARSWDDKIVVPSRTGVSIISFAPQPVEAYQDLSGPLPTEVQEPQGAAVDAAPATLPGVAAPAGTQPASATRSTSGEADMPQPQVLFDGQGFLAWIPWERGKRGGRGAARFANGKWTVLDSTSGWPDRILHLIPLLGGSVMQLIAEEGGAVRINVTAQAGASIDRKEVERLVIQLAAPSQRERDDAFARLSRFGPAIRPILKELLQDEQPPEAQVRMRQLMREQVQPLLGPMSLLGDKLQLVTRHRDGGVVFYVEAGVSITNADGDPISEVPAWLAIRPGPAVYLLPNTLVGDSLPDRAKVIAVESHDDDWVVVSDARGPRRFVGNALVNLVRKDETQFTELLGVDHRGRWLFRKLGNDDDTLVLDPTLTEPRLPVWNYTAADEVGWDKDNWPTIRQFGVLSRLREESWELLDKDKGEELLTRPDQIPTTTQPVTQPSRQATTRAGPEAATPATQLTASTTRPGGSISSTQPTLLEGEPEPPILVTSDGTRYYGGLTDLRVAKPTGSRTTWTLPPVANGQGQPRLIRTNDGRLYLFNQPGRVLRIKPTAPGSAVEPFAIEATFTRNIPSEAKPTRIWLDPAGRIIIAHNKNLAILFPSGFIPPALRLKMVDPDDADGPQ